MSTNIRSAKATATGVLKDSTSDVTVTDTRIRGIQASGAGAYEINGTSTTAFNTVVGNDIKFTISTDTYMDLSAIGVKMDGIVSVVVPASGNITVFYG